MIAITYVTITYNAASVLQRTLDSVLAQDYPDIVHLIIDGASTDGTLDLVNAYIERSNAANNGHRIHVTSEPDKGIYDAMNKALRFLPSLRSLHPLPSPPADYVCFLNAGDFLPSPSTVSCIIRELQSGHNGDCPLCEQRSELQSGHNGDCPLCEQRSELQGDCPQCDLPAVLYGDTSIVDTDGNYLRPRRLSPPDHLSWKSFRQGMLVCHQAFYARTDFAIATPYDQQYRYSADVDWCIRVMKAAAKENVPLLNLHMVVVNYTQEGQTTLHHRESLWERYRVMERHYGRIQTFFLHCWFVVRSVISR